MRPDRLGADRHGPDRQTGLALCAIASLKLRVHESPTLPQLESLGSMGGSLL